MNGLVTMERSELINEIIYLYIGYGLIKNPVDKQEIISSIDKNLNNIDYVETLIKTIIKRTGNRRNIDIDRIIKIRSELELLRIELEYK